MTLLEREKLHTTLLGQKSPQFVRFDAQRALPGRKDPGAQNANCSTYRSAIMELQKQESRPSVTTALKKPKHSKPYT
jgi:hypothetical protein